MYFFSTGQPPTLFVIGSGTGRGALLPAPRGDALRTINGRAICGYGRVCDCALAFQGLGMLLYRYDSIGHVCLYVCIVLVMHVNICTNRCYLCVRVCELRTINGRAVRGHDRLCNRPFTRAWMGEFSLVVLL